MPFFGSSRASRPDVSTDGRQSRWKSMKSSIRKFADKFDDTVYYETERTATSGTPSDSKSAAQAFGRYARSFKKTKPHIIGDNACEIPAMASMNPLLSLPNKDSDKQKFNKMDSYGGFSKASSGFGDMSIKYGAVDRVTKTRKVVFPVYTRRGYNSSSDSASEFVGVDKKFVEIEVNADLSSMAQETSAEHTINSDKPTNRLITFGRKGTGRVRHHHLIEGMRPTTERGPSMCENVTHAADYHVFGAPVKYVSTANTSTDDTSTGCFGFNAGSRFKNWMSSCLDRTKDRHSTRKNRGKSEKSSWRSGRGGGSDEKQSLVYGKSFVDSDSASDTSSLKSAAG